MSLWPFVFVRKGVTMWPSDYNHERIHLRQQSEMLVIPFLIWYALEWIVRLFMHGNAYRNISFEREAYINELRNEYLNSRHRWAWVKYLNKGWVAKK